MIFVELIEKNEKKAIINNYQMSLTYNRVGQTLWVSCHSLCEMWPYSELFWSAFSYIWT